MGSSPPPANSGEEALLERIRTLYAQLDDANPKTPEYESLSAEIRDVSTVYARLVGAKSGVDRLDP
jgi:hypothetical protein